MKTTQITTVQLEPFEGKVLVKVLPSDNGKYIKDSSRYDIITSTLVHAPESDVENWQEADSLEAFLTANEFTEFKEPES